MQVDLLILFLPQTKYRIAGKEKEIGWLVIKIIGLEILASILSVGRSSRLIKVLKEDQNLVESVYADVNAGEFGGLFLVEASCENKDTFTVENQINNEQNNSIEETNPNIVEVQELLGSSTNSFTDDTNI